MRVVSRSCKVVYGWLLSGIIVFLGISAPLFASPPATFSEAKRIAENLHADSDRTFYCGCSIQWNRTGRDAIDLDSCGYQVRKRKDRAALLEWEHVMPAADFGRQRQCWQKGGRKNCERTDSEFQKMEADLFNLQPSIGG